MAKCIIYENESGGVSVLVPNEAVRLPSESDDEFVSRIFDSDVPGTAINPHIIDMSELPPPAVRRFRGQWKHNGTNIYVPLDAARAKLLAEARERRNARLTESDMRRLKLEETGTPIQKIAVADYRQKLRDLPTQVQSEVNALDTLDGLISYMETMPSDNSDNLSPEQQATFKQKLKDLAKTLTTSDDSTVRLVRSTVRIIYQSVNQHRQWTNQLLTALKNTVIGPSIPNSIQALPIRTWQQLMAAVQADIDSETDPTA